MLPPNLDFRDYYEITQQGRMVCNLFFQVIPFVFVLSFKMCGLFSLHLSQIAYS